MSLGGPVGACGVLHCALVADAGCCARATRKGVEHARIGAPVCHGSEPIQRRPVLGAGRSCCALASTACATDALFLDDAASAQFVTNLCAATKDPELLMNPFSKDFKAFAAKIRGIGGEYLSLVLLVIVRADAASSFVASRNMAGLNVLLQQLPSEYTVADLACDIVDFMKQVDPVRCVL